MVKNGIDWHPIAIEVNKERKRLIATGCSPEKAFDYAFIAVMKQYPMITGALWGEGKPIVGKIMRSWKRIEVKQETKRSYAHRIRKVSSSEEHLLMIIDGKYRVLVTRGKRRINLSVREDGHTVRQSKIPPELIKRAREMGMEHFGYPRTLPLPFSGE